MSLTPREQAILDRYVERTKQWAIEQNNSNNNNDSTQEQESKEDTTQSNNDFVQQINDASIEELLNSGRAFYNNDKDNDKYVGVAHSLGEAQAYVNNTGFIATMPLLIAAKSLATTQKNNVAVRDTNHYLWKDWFTAFSEENVGIDVKGKYVSKGKPIIITVHGGGLLHSKERILQAYKIGLTPQNAARYINNKGKSSGEFEQLLNKKIVNNQSIEIYSVEDVLKGKVKNPFGLYAVWNDFETAKSTTSGYLQESDFLNNELVLARSGTSQYLTNYFSLAKNSSGKVGNWHRLTEIDPNVPQGRVLFLNYCDYGLSSSLNGYGRFVGVRTGGSP